MYALVLQMSSSSSAEELLRGKYSHSLGDSPGKGTVILPERGQQLTDDCLITCLPTQLVLPKRGDLLHGEEQPAHGRPEGRRDAGRRARGDEVPPVLRVAEPRKERLLGQLLTY